MLQATLKFIYLHHSPSEAATPVKAQICLCDFACLFWGSSLQSFWSGHISACLSSQLRQQKPTAHSLGTDIFLYDCFLFVLQCCKDAFHKLVWAALSLELWEKKMLFGIYIIGNANCSWWNSLEREQSQSSPGGSSAEALEQSCCKRWRIFFVN